MPHELGKENDGCSLAEMSNTGRESWSVKDPRSSQPTCADHAQRMPDTDMQRQRVGRAEYPVTVVPQLVTEVQRRSVIICRLHSICVPGARFERLNGLGPQMGSALVDDGSEQNAGPVRPCSLIRQVSVRRPTPQRKTVHRPQRMLAVSQELDGTPQCPERINEVALQEHPLQSGQERACVVVSEESLAFLADVLKKIAGSQHLARLACPHCQLHPLTQRSLDAADGPGIPGRTAGGTRN
jgi:hypothetical protein